MDNPGLLLTILASYLYFCNVAGPRMMKNRKPFELKGIMLVYNAFQVVFSAYIAWEVRIFIAQVNATCSIKAYFTLNKTAATRTFTLSGHAESKQTRSWQILEEFILVALNKLLI